jgi:hypothetical protein
VDTTFTVDTDPCNHRGFIGLSSDDVTVAISRAPDVVTISGTHQSVPVGASGPIDPVREFVDVCGMANPAGYSAECCWTGGWDGTGWTVGTLFCCGVNNELPGGCPICWLVSY